MNAENQEAAPADNKKAPASFKHVVGVKKGMTHVVLPEGQMCGATVVDVTPAVVTAIRTPEKDGYSAIQVGFGTKPEKQVTKPLAGQYKNGGLKPAAYVREFRVADVKGFEIGQLVDAESRFVVEDYVDIQGTTKGKGFAGVMKRHNFAGLPASHGASDKQRSPGSLAARRSLGRVLPGQRMAGHLGHVTCTVQKVEIVKMDPATHTVYLKGSVPGPKGSYVSLSQTVKLRKHKVHVKRSTVLRDKMGNIITAKGAKAAAQAKAKAAPEKK